MEGVFFHGAEPASYWGVSEPPGQARPDGLEPPKEGLLQIRGQGPSSPPTFQGGKRAVYGCPDSASARTCVVPLDFQESRARGGSGSGTGVPSDLAP